MNYSQAKKQAYEMVESTRAALVEKLKKGKAFKALTKELELDENDRNTHLVMDDSGWLCLEKEITLDDSLCRDEAGEIDTELAKAVLSEASEHLNFRLADGSSGDTFIVSECYGEPTIVNESPERHCYAVYSHELGLKIDKIESEEHGLMIVEQAMRKHGIFGDVVSTDYYGNPSRLNIPEKVRDASVTELQAMIDKIENNEGEE